MSRGEVSVIVQAQDEGGSEQGMLGEGGKSGWILGRVWNPVERSLSDCV